MASKSRPVVFTALIAALYFTFTIALAPIGYGQIQFRLSEVLKPLALFSPVFALGFGLGNFLANLSSPFGFMDWGIMAIVDTMAAFTCWRLRRFPIIAVGIQAFIISAGVAIFPLGIAGGFSIPFSFVSVFVSELFILEIGYLVIWKPLGLKWFQP